MLRDCPNSTDLHRAIDQAINVVRNGTFWVKSRYLAYVYNVCAGWVLRWDADDVRPFHLVIGSAPHGRVLHGQAGWI